MYRLRDVPGCRAVVKSSRFISGDWAPSYSYLLFVDMVDVTPILTASGISAQSFNPTRNEQIADSSHNYAYRVPMNGLEVEL